MTRRAQRWRKQRLQNARTWVTSSTLSPCPAWSFYFAKVEQHERRRPVLIGIVVGHWGRHGVKAKYPQAANKILMRRFLHSAKGQAGQGFGGRCCGKYQLRGLRA